jgi:hypothetical protein
MSVEFFSQSSYNVSNSSFHNPVYGNYKFDIDLTYFGVMRERKFRKVNRIQSLLKLREIKDVKSIYPMVDEFGYSFSDFFIFKSTWDYGYNIETILSKNETLKDMGIYYSSDKFLGKSLNHVGKMIQDWQESLDFTVGRPKFNDFKE